MLLASNFEQDDSCVEGPEKREESRFFLESLSERAGKVFRNKLGFLLS